MSRKPKQLRISVRDKTAGKPPSLFASAAQGLNLVVVATQGGTHEPLGSACPDPDIAAESEGAKRNGGTGNGSICLAEETASAQAFAQILTEISRSRTEIESDGRGLVTNAWGDGCKSQGPQSPSRRKHEPSSAGERLFQTLFEFAPIGIALHDANGKHLHTNPFYRRMVGYTNTELLELDAQCITHPEDVAEGRQLFHELRDGVHEHCQCEKRYLHKDGHIVLAHSVASAVRNSAGGLQYIISVVEDVTKRKYNEELAATFGDLGQELSAATTPHDAAVIIGDVAAVLFGWDSCYLHLFGSSGEIIPVLTIDTINGQKTALPPGDFTPGPSPMMTDIAAKGGRLVNRMHPDSQLAPELARFGGRNCSSASIMCVPIRTSTQTLGVLSIQSYRVDAYDENDLRALQALADHCAGALGRINAVEDLRQSESRLRALLDALPDVMLRLRRDGTVIDCKINAADPASVLFRQCVGGKLHELWPPRLVQGILLHVARALQKETTQIFDFEYPAGRQGRDYEVRVVRSGSDEALVIVRDFSERKQLEKEVLAISAREQARMGKDLHDGLGQLLTGMAFLARALREKLTAKASKEAEDAGQIVQLALRATTQTRLMARGLFPAELETKGIAAALKELAYTIGKLHKVSCSAEVDVSLRFGRKAIEKHLYRIVQEATTNAIKHGQCARVEVDLRRTDGSARLTVKDDGVGLSNGTPSPDGMGIRIMRYRARRIGGQLSIRQPGSGGTEVIVEFPS